YAYKMNEASSQQTVAGSLRAQFGRPYDPEDIFMTNGATGALYVTIQTIADAGDEVIYISPPWFGYEEMIRNAGATPVGVRIDPVSFDLDLESIAAAITPRTRLIIVNSPNNPTGKIYPPETLRALGSLLAGASQQYGRPIYLLSDEAYRRILFDGNQFPSPSSFYPFSFIVYTYGKTLLTPGQRLGYIAISPEMPEREAMRNAIFTMQANCGYAFASALLQHALADLEPLCIDMEQMQVKRDRLVEGLREAGYEVHAPEGTFYLLPKAPLADDIAFADQLAAEGVLVLPGTICEMPGYLRLSLTANEAMIDRALPVFQRARARA
ncbi:MAG: aminotransferase class I/II-fold pyridoxal phosphate-dependent enzyme, partial [Anaerolineales bacterium]|nr:aminotransferase class I/II-fold pyridoxal phosphate-dependent enzyme [Anaerolineales bacterium]